MFETSITVIRRMLLTRERHRHQIPAHLYKQGNYSFPKFFPSSITSFISFEPIPFETGIHTEYLDPALYNALLSYGFESSTDPLVLCVKNIKRDKVFRLVLAIELKLRELNANRKASHTIDWWYRPPGQVEGHALVAIRPCGLYELTWDCEEML